MSALPAIAPEVPATLVAGATDPALARLAYTLANAGLLQPADLRVGSGGLRRMIERVWLRWWQEADLPRRVGLNLRWRILTSAGALSGARLTIDATTVALLGLDGGASGHAAAWLVLDCDRAAARAFLCPGLAAYLERGRGTPAARAAIVEHALAVLYAGLDRLCYAITPPVWLAMARRYWWGGADDLAPGVRRSAGMLTRRMFETRFAPLTLAPWRHWAWAALTEPGGPALAWNARVVEVPRAWQRRQVDAMRAAGLRGAPLLDPATGLALHPWPEVVAVEAALRRATLDRNARELTGRMVVDVPLHLRWRSDDDHRHLLDAWSHELDQAQSDAARGSTTRASTARVCFTGAWPLNTVDEIRTARARLPATVRLAAAVDALLCRVASRSFGGFYT